MLSNLKNAGIKVVGSGRNLNESRQMLSLNVNGIRVGFIAYSAETTNGYNYATDTAPGVTPLDEGYIAEDIKKYKEEVDHLIVSLHWGVEYSPYPTPDQIMLAHKIIDSGAKLIIGHHPHMLQGVEHYNDGIIVYSLGNFCDSDLYWEGQHKTYQSKLKVADRETAAFNITLSKTKILRVNMTPLWLNDYGQPEVCEGETLNNILEKIKERSETIKRPDFEKCWEDLIIKKRIAKPFRTWWENGNIFYKLKNFKPSQLKTVWEFFLMYIQTKFAKNRRKWFLINPGNDKKPRPYCGGNEEN